MAADWPKLLRYSRTTLDVRIGGGDALEQGRNLRARIHGTIS